MAAKSPKIGSLLATGLVLGLLLVGAMYLRQRFQLRQSTLPAKPAAPPSTRPATSPTTAPGSAAPRTYMDLVARQYPDFPTTQPLDRPLSVAFAGHIVLRDPVYLDGRGTLWVTRSDAAPMSTNLSSAGSRPLSIVPRRVVFVHWMNNDAGDPMPWLVCPDQTNGGYALVSSDGECSIGRPSIDYQWDRAFSWDRRIVVPTDTGASVFTIGPGSASESSSPALAQPGDGHGPVQLAFMGGPIAWIPPHGQHPGSAGAVRCVEDAWFPLTRDAGWPAGIIHLVPLLDGNVLQLLAGEGESIKLSMVPLDRPNVNESAIEQLVFQLSDPDPVQRDKAFAQLAEYGSAVWRVADRMMPDEPPETQARLKDLLKAKTAPLLGSMQLADGKMRLVQRYADGGALFYSERGVLVPHGQDQPQVIAPAWLSIRPGQFVRLLPADMVHDLDPSRSILSPCGSDDWIASGGAGGPEMYMGGGVFSPLLRSGEEEFRRFVGVARDRRLVFATQPAKAVSATSPTADALPAGSGPTLIIDPRLPDPKPSLPVWLLSYDGGTAGWDAKDWPAAKRQGAWALLTGEWRPIDETKERFFTKAAELPGPPPRPRSHADASSQPATTQSSVAPEERPLLVDADGRFYFGGKTNLIVLSPDGASIEWELPAIATGRIEPHLVRTADGRLYLYNQAGRLLRIKPTPGAVEPFQIEATFTRRIPNTKEVQRMWLDPAGRIVMAYDDNKLAILFPQGYLPPETVNLLTADELDELVRQSAQ